MLQPKRFYHALVAMMISTQVFAGVLDIAALDLASNNAGDLGPIIAQANTAYGSAHGGPLFTQDVALISQAGGDADYALINQESHGGAGNFAAITQSGLTPSIAYIFQSGGGKGGSMAVIRQH